MMRFRSRLRQPALYAAGLSILFLLMATACGGGNGGNGGAAPTATAAPATQSPAQTPAAPAATPGAPAQGESSSGSEKLFISANETGEITVQLVAGDVLEVSFNAQSNIVGGQNVSAGIGGASEGIQLAVRDPLETTLHTITDTTASDTVTVEAEVNGEHKVFFFNPFALQAVTVEVSWMVNP